MTKSKDPWFRNRLIRNGIYRALHEEMKARPEIYVLGEGSHMKMHFDAPNILAEFENKILTLPISEDANSNFAVGLALDGLVPVVDVISSDFLFRTMDAVCNTMAKGNAVGRPATIVVRSEFLTGGPTSGQRVEALFAKIPGLSVAVPSNPLDAYVLMRSALRRRGVTVFFEDRMIEDSKMPMKYLDTEAEPPYTVEGARVAKLSAQGPLVVSYGLTLRIAEDALAEEKATVVDLRTLYPLDMDQLVQHARRTLRVLVVEPDSKFLGIGAEVCAEVSERLPGCVVRRLAGPRATIPASRELHDLFVPNNEQILEAVKSLYVRGEGDRK